METIDLNVGEGRTIETVISEIKNSKTSDVPSWIDLVKQYDPQKHDIVTDKRSRKDKTNAAGDVEKVARITYGMQKLSAKRMTQMGFAIPVKRLYKTGDDATKKAQAEAIEAVYTKARIDAVNNKRMNAYFAACEVFTVWFPVPDKNKSYGFDAEHKLKCVTYSPMDKRFSRLSTATIYPVFDKYDDLIIMAFEYKVLEDKVFVTYFQIYTKDQDLLFKNATGSGWTDISAEDSTIAIGKIPGVYLWRPMPVWEETTGNVHEIEVSLSRESDILRKNSAPIIKIRGKLVGEAPATEKAREVYQMDGDGDISYVTWTQQVEALKYHVDTLKQNIEEELQLPNLSFDNVKSISAITEGARKTLLTDAHLKVGDESGDIIEFLDRECNVIKAFLGQMNTKWKDSIGDLEVEHVITPFIQNDGGTRIDNLTKATGKPVMSQKEGVRQLGMVDDVEAEYKQLQDEEKAANNLNVFEPTA